jgi:hypothetical protein
MDYRFRSISDYQLGNYDVRKTTPDHCAAKKPNDKIRFQIVKKK